MENKERVAINLRANLIDPDPSTLCESQYCWDMATKVATLYDPGDPAWFKVPTPPEEGATSILLCPEHATFEHALAAWRWEGRMRAWNRKLCAFRLTRTFGSMEAEVWWSDVDEQYVAQIQIPPPYHDAKHQYTGKTPLGALYSAIEVTSQRWEGVERTLREKNIA